MAAALLVRQLPVLSAPVFAFYPALLRSVVLTTATTAVSLLVATPTAYALARLHVPGTARILAAMLAFAFFPGIVLLVPLSVTSSAVGLLDRLVGIGIAQLSFTVPLAVWFLTYAFRQVPLEVEEAALMDGASRTQLVRGCCCRSHGPASRARPPWSSWRPGTTSCSAAC